MWFNYQCAKCGGYDVFKPTKVWGDKVETTVPGLVFAGMGTVPGVGVPMVLISGRLAAERVLNR